MNATDQLLRLCNEILETVSLETGQVLEKPESFDVQELVQRNINLLQPVARNKQLTLSGEISNAVPKYIKGLRAYFERIILNLISNALKFTEIGFVKITLALESSPKHKLKLGDKVTLSLTVEDSGIGIPEDKFDVIFEHFSRLTPSFEGIYKGSGLGLYTVKQYLKAMHGQVSIESELSKGSTFTLQIPFIVAEHSDYNSRTIQFKKLPAQVTEFELAPEEAAISDHTPGEGKASGCILVVEDSYPAAVAIKMLLTTKFNCRVDMASNGSEGFEKAANEKYDLILMDIGLPDMDGMLVAQKIRTLPLPYGNVPIVALTGHMDKRDECLAANMQDVLVKPAQPMILENILQRFVFKKMQVENTQETAGMTTIEQKNALPLINWEATVRMCSSDEKMAQELFILFADELKLASERLEKSYKEKDTKALRSEVHRCLSGVCYLALPKLENDLRAFHATLKTESEDIKIMEEAYGKLKKTIGDFLVACEKNNFNP